MTARQARIAGAALTLSAVVLLGACHSGGGGGGGNGGFTQTVHGDGTSGTVNMKNPKVPADFPSSAVPLPADGKLQAVVSGKHKNNHYFTFTYALGGKNGRMVGSEYRRTLEKANFTIKNYSSSGGSDGGFTTFDATSPDWDLSVVSGKGTRLEPSAISVQVTTHGTLSDDLKELDILDNGSTDTTTTLPIP